MPGPLNPHETIALLSNQSGVTTGIATGMRVFGGDYICSIVGTIGGSSAQLQYLGADGTWQNLGAARTTVDSGNTPVGGFGVTLSGNSRMRCELTGGAPSGVYVTLSRIP